MRTTIARVNAALKAKGYTDELQRGRGYFYFWGDDAAGWFTSSVGVYHLNSFTVDQWIAQYEAMRNQYQEKR